MSTARTQCAGEAGFSLVEITMVAAVLALVFPLVYLIATNFVTQTIQGTGQGAAAEAAQSELPAIDQYLRGAVVPATAASYYQTLLGAPPATSATFCGSGPTSTTSTAVTAPPGGGVAAGPYTLTICAVPAQAKACNGSSASTTCAQRYTITLADCQTTNVWTCTLKAYDDDSSPANAVVGSVANVHCDSTCQANLSSGGACPEASCLFTYYNASSAAVTSTDPLYPGDISSVAVDLQLDVLPIPPGPATSQPYVEVRDQIWLSGPSAVPT